MLSFGLMMTGCDSGGDSDSGDPINAGDYISIEEDPVGDANTAAVFTVTVKQSLGGKVVTFTNVATADVVYGPPADADDTVAKQAAAIVAKLNAAAGAIYDVAYTASAESFTLTARTPGAIANAPAVTIDNYEAPPAKTSDAFTVTAGDNALKITGTTTTAAFKDGTGIKVYIKNTGKEVLITDNSDDTAYTQVTGAVLIAATESNKPVLWVKGLTAAVSGDAVAGKILAGADVKVVITGGAQTGDVGDITPVSGTAVVLPAGVKTLIAFGAAIANQVSVKGGAGSNQIHYHNGTGDVTATLSATFDTQLSAVLASTGLLAADDKITVDAKGIITGAEIIVAGTQAKINPVLALLDTTLGVTNTVTDGALTIPAGKTLTVGASVTLNSGAFAVTINGTLVVGSSGNTVTITKGSITPAATAATLGVGSTGVITMVNTDVLALADGGSVTVAGTGKIALLHATINAGTYTAAGAVTITAKTLGDTIVTGTNADDGLVMTGAVSLLTQGTSAATYTFTKGGTADARVVIAGTGITVPESTSTSAKLATDGKAKITLGTGSITLKPAVSTGSFLTGTFDLANGDKIGVFTTATKGTASGGSGENVTVSSITGGCVLGANTDGALDLGSSATLTVGTNGLNLKGGGNGDPDAVISAATVITTNDGS